MQRLFTSTSILIALCALSGCGSLTLGMGDLAFIDDPFASHVADAGIVRISSGDANNTGPATVEQPNRPAPFARYADARTSDSIQVYEKSGEMVNPTTTTMAFDTTVPPFNSEDPAAYDSDQTRQHDIPPVSDATAYKSVAVVGGEPANPFETDPFSPQAHVEAASDPVAARGFQPVIGEKREAGVAADAQSWKPSRRFSTSAAPLAN